MTPNQKKQRAEKLAEAARAAGADLDSLDLRDLVLGLAAKVDTLIEVSRARASLGIDLEQLEEVLTGRGARAVARGTDPAARAAGTAEASSTQGPPSIGEAPPRGALGMAAPTAPPPASGAEVLREGLVVVVDLKMGGLTAGVVLAVDAPNISVDCGARGGGVHTVHVDQVALAPRSVRR